MKKSSLDIKAHDFQVIVVGEREKESNTGQFDDKGIHFTIVLWFLTKALRN